MLPPGSANILTQSSPIINTPNTSGDTFSRSSNLLTRSTPSTPTPNTPNSSTAGQIPGFSYVDLDHDIYNIGSPNNLYNSIYSPTSDPFSHWSPLPSVLESNSPGSGTSTSSDAINNQINSNPTLTPPVQTASSTTRTQSSRDGFLIK